MFASVRIDAGMKNKGKRGDLIRKPTLWSRKNSCTHYLSCVIKQNKLNDSDVVNENRSVISLKYYSWRCTCNTLSSSSFFTSTYSYIH